MEKILRLKLIQTVDQNDNSQSYYDDVNSSGENGEILKKKIQYQLGDLARKHFNDSFKDIPLRDRKELDFIYELHLRVVPDETKDDWKILNDNNRKDDCLTSFHCDKEDEFLEKFEEKLKHHLRMLLCDDPYQQAHCTMNGITPPPK